MQQYVRLVEVETHAIIEITPIVVARSTKDSRFRVPNLLRIGQRSLRYGRRVEVGVFPNCSMRFDL
jgi:hypothetical protein